MNLIEVDEILREYDKLKEQKTDLEQYKRDVNKSADQQIKSLNWQIEFLKETLDEKLRGEGRDKVKTALGNFRRGSFTRVEYEDETIIKFADENTEFAHIVETVVKRSDVKALMSMGISVPGVKEIKEETIVVSINKNSSEAQRDAEAKPNDIKPFWNEVAATEKNRSNSKKKNTAS